MNNMKIFRKQKGITLQELADITGLSIGYMCHLENGTRTNPSYSVMKSVANGLNKEIADIFK